MKKSVVILLLAWLCVQNFALISYASPEEATEYKETIEVMTFITAHPGELGFVTNIWLIFENTRTALPINTSIEALNDRFIALQYSFTPAGSKFFVSFDLFYKLEIDNGTANSYADKIEDEFFKAFGYSGLESVLGGRVLTTTKEGEKKIVESFGYIPLTYETVSAFLRFAPENGLGGFINGLMQKYVPDNSICAEYWLKKIGSDFYWDVKIVGLRKEILPWDVKDHSTTINLKELLNTQSTIIDQPPQRIVILIQENRTIQLSRGLTMYSVEIQSIKPEGYTIAPSADWPNWVEIKYESPLSPIENVEIQVNINSSILTTSDQDVRVITVVALVITGVALSIVLTVILYVKKKREGGEKVERKRT